MKIKCSGPFSGHLGKHIIPKCKLNQKCQLLPIHALIHKVCLFRHPRLFLVKVHFHHGCYILIEKKPLQGMKEMMVFWRVLIYYSTGFQLTFYRLYPSHLLCHRVEFSSVECPAVLHAHLHLHNAQVQSTKHGLNAHGATSGTWPRPAKSSNHFTHPPPPPVLSNALKIGLNCNHSLKYILDAQKGQLA